MDLQGIAQLGGVLIMQAILTKYLPATNSRGERVKAFCDAGSITEGWDYGLGQEANHRAVATALANKFGWLDYGHRVEAGSYGNGYVFVLVKEGE